MNQPLHVLLPNLSLPQAVAQLGVNHWRLDSRQVQAGDGFIAVPGTLTDGRKFVTQAIAQGAGVVLQTGDSFAYQTLEGVPVITVPQLMAQLGSLLAHHYGSNVDKPVIAITGTNGKTSVAGFIQQLTAQMQQPWGLLGTFGACFAGRCEDLGLTTADAASVHRHWAEFRAQGAQGLVLEASSHALHQQRLAGLPITVGVWTNLSRDHLDYHGSMAAYAEAKALLWHRPKLGAVVYSLDHSEVAAQAPSHVNAITYGANENNSIYYRGLRCHAGGIDFVLHHKQQQWDVKVPLFGAFNVDNLLAALAALMAAGYQLEELLPLVSELQPVVGRMEQVEASQGPAVVVDFAHTPDGLQAALSALGEHFERRIICVFGCGGDRDKGKRPLMAQAAEQGASEVWLTSDNPRTESPDAILSQVATGFSADANVHKVEDRAEAIVAAIHSASAKDVVLIAGKGHEQEQIVGTKRLPFSDVLVAQAALETWRPAL